MKKFLFCGTAAAVLIGGAAVAQTAANPAKPMHGHAMKNEARADVQANVAKMFARLDLNHDGFITQAELDSVAAQRSEKMQQRAERFDPSKAFARLDANHDGKITPAEVDAARDKRIAAKGGQPAPAHAAAFHGLFARADANKDGVVTSAEFNVVGEQLKARMEKASTRHGFGSRLLADADTNKDGKVSLAEAQQLALAHFDRADLNHDGTLTPQERQQARQSMKAQKNAR